MVFTSGSEQDCRALPTEIVAGNAGFVYDWCRKHAMIHDKRMFAERAFFCYGIYPVEGIGVFRVPKNGDARNKKPPALRVETKRCTKKSPFRYNRVVQALL